MNSQSTASESSGSLGMIAPPLFASQPEHAIPFVACTLSNVRTTCSSSQDTINWGGCTVVSGLAYMTGSWTEVFNGTSASSCLVPIVSGEQVTRTSNGSTIVGPFGGHVETDTDGGTAWDGTVLGSSGTTITNSSGTRTIAINGTHKAGYDAMGTKLFDHFITSSGLTVTGTRALGTRTLTGGTIQVYHNLAKYTAALTFSGVKWTDPNCCFPTEGTITGTLTGSVTGTTSLTFGTTGQGCNYASYTDTTGTTTTPKLTQCN
jgi:hypothetical protein